MKRNIFKTLLFSSALAVTVSSCEMDQFPNDSISAETAWQSVDDAIKFRNGIIQRNFYLFHTIFCCTGKT